MLALRRSSTAAAHRGWRVITTPLKPVLVVINCVGAVAALDTTGVSVAELERLQLAHDMGEVRSLLAGLRRSGWAPICPLQRGDRPRREARGRRGSIELLRRPLSQSHRSVVTFNATMRLRPRGQWGHLGADGRHGLDGPAPGRGAERHLLRLRHPGRRTQPPLGPPGADGMLGAQPEPPRFAPPCRRASTAGSGSA